jgi:hypothetical protein
LNEDIKALKTIEFDIEKPQKLKKSTAKEKKKESPICLRVVCRFDKQRIPGSLK